MNYVVGIDQSTQGTKAILVDTEGKLIGRVDRPHEQIVNEKGWVSHNLEEIYQNVRLVVADVVEKTGIRKEEIAAIGISNQRETTALWDKKGNPLAPAIVWQCSRAKEIADEKSMYANEIKERTGLTLSPYFPAAKMAWLLENIEGMKQKSASEYCLGTIDSWLIYRMTEGKSFKTDYSNASRTQLFNIHTLQWDKEICNIFGIPVEALAKVCDSNSCFGNTTLDGYFEKEVPILSALGDSHAALYGQGCHEPGMLKTTYGTGSSIMMNIGEEPVDSRYGLVTSLAWGIDGKVNYVLEGNINYTGAVITWLKDDVRLISSPGETQELAQQANPQDETVLVPAFSGLSAPYWNNNARAVLCNMSRTTGRNEIVKAALDSIAFQIQAVVLAMEKDSQKKIKEIRVDGGPTKNTYLMQRQSDLLDAAVAISDNEEVSAIGAAYMAGVKAGILKEEQIFGAKKRHFYYPDMMREERTSLTKRWEEAVSMLTASPKEAEYKEKQKEQLKKETQTVKATKIKEEVLSGKDTKKQKGGEHDEQ